MSVKPEVFAELLDRFEQAVKLGDTKVTSGVALGMLCDQIRSIKSTLLDFYTTQYNVAKWQWVERSPTYRLRHYDDILFGTVSGYPDGTAQFTLFASGAPWVIGNAPTFEDAMKKCDEAWEKKTGRK